MSAGLCRGWVFVVVAVVVAIPRARRRLPVAGRGSVLCDAQPPLAGSRPDASGLLRISRADLGGMIPRSEPRPWRKMIFGSALPPAATVNGHR